MVRVEFKRALALRSEIQRQYRPFLASGAIDSPLWGARLDGAPYTGAHSKASSVCGSCGKEIDSEDGASGCRGLVGPVDSSTGCARLRPRISRQWSRRRGHYPRSQPLGRGAIPPATFRQWSRRGGRYLGSQSLGRGAISRAAFRPTSVHPTVIPVRGGSWRSGRCLRGTPLRPSVLSASLLRCAGELYAAERDGLPRARSHAERRTIPDRAVRVARRWDIDAVHVGVDPESADVAASCGSHSAPRGPHHFARRRAGLNQQAVSGACRPSLSLDR